MVKKKKANSKKRIEQIEQIGQFENKQEKLADGVNTNSQELPSYTNNSRFAILIKNLFLGLAIWLVAYSTFVNLPVKQITDARFMFLLSQAIAYDHTTRLDPYLISNPELKPRRDFFYWWWQLSPQREGKVIHHHSGEWDGKDPLYYRYPNLPSILSIPIIVVFNQIADIKIVRGGNFSFPDEDIAHKFFAAILAAFIVVQIFFLSKLILPTTYALLVTLVCGFGTQVFSTLSRGVWSDTWAVLISLFAIHHLLSHAVGKSKLRPIYLAFIASLAFFCKPNYAVVAMAVVIYTMYTFYKSGNVKPLYWLIATGCIGVFSFIGFSLYQFGTIIPDYYVPAFEFKFIPEALLGHSFSPSRGIFIFSPFLLMVIYLLIYYRKLNNFIILTRITYIPIIILIFVSSAWGTWWGGHSYGPRLLAPLLPWLILLTVIAAYLHFQASRLPKKNKTNNKINHQQITAIISAITIAISILIHWQGAAKNETWFPWFYEPYPVFQNPQKRLWNWSDAQFLAGIKSRPIVIQ